MLSPLNLWHLRNKLLTLGFEEGGTSLLFSIFSSEKLRFFTDFIFFHSSRCFLLCSKKARKSSVTSISSFVSWMCIPCLIWEYKDSVSLWFPWIILVLLFFLLFFFILFLCFFLYFSLNGLFKTCDCCTLPLWGCCIPLCREKKSFNGFNQSH